MRITNRLVKWNRRATRLACLFAACSVFYACTDEYLLDDKAPEWLGTNLYDNLLQRGNFTNYLRLLSDPAINVQGSTSMKDVLQRTGSKTLFVANDDAWAAFFKKNATLPDNNPWKSATSYEALSTSQKKLLLHSSMLNNSIVLENLASSEGQGNSSPTRGEFLRRNTDYEPTDSVSFIPMDQVPQTFSITDRDYWQYYRENGKGIWLSTDNTENMMIAFTNEHMKKNAITDEDFARIMGTERATDDVFVYDSRVIEKDNVCQNGYLNVMSKPLVPLPNMAELIRTSGRTNIFSHLLDRYSAPIYNAALTRDYKVLHPEFPDGDSIFVRRYFSSNSIGLEPWDKQPAPGGTTESYKPYRDDVKSEDIGVIPSLKFDPGWNAYIADDYKASESMQKLGLHKDMAAMFVPNDEAMTRYWTKASGADFIRTYGDPSTFTDTGYELIFNEGEKGMIQNIDRVPLDRVQRLINLIMQRSFIGSVPSKMTKLRDDALEQMFYETDVKDSIDTCMVACNGAVYIMKAVYGPADFTSVTSPAVISKTNQIMNWAIYNGENPAVKDHMNLNYYAYLKAMQSRFTFFMPSDAAMQYYYDSFSFHSNRPRLISMTYKDQNNKDLLPIDYKLYTYGTGKGKSWENSGVKGAIITSSSEIDPEKEIPNRLRDVLESHTIVHDGTNDIKGVDEYFLSKNGNAIKVVRDIENHIVQAKGALQIETERDAEESGRELEINPGVVTCHVTKASEGLKNGQTYILDAPMLPTYRSVYSIMTSNIQNFLSLKREEAYEKSPYAAFFYLTAGLDQRILKSCGLIDMSKKPTTAQINRQQSKFQIFSENDGKCLDQNVTFFNNYHYTAFIPTNDAIDDAVENGLPTWESIKEDFANRCKIKRDDNGDPIIDSITIAGDTVWQKTDTLATYEDSLIIQAKITYLTNFIRYHFADNTIFADHSQIDENQVGEMVTSCYDKETGLFSKLYVRRDPTGRGETPQMFVRDYVAKKDGRDSYRIITNKINGKDVTNILTRDVVSDKKIADTSMRGAKLVSSSTSVMHMIPGVLNHVDLKGGRHDEYLQSPINARNYMKRFAIEK